MTRALVVYESLFGDARTIAQAIAAGLSESVPADAVAAAEAPAEIGPDVALLVVGGPNHAFGMPRPSTRGSAVSDHGAVVPDTATGLREWLEAVRAPAGGVRAAAFDTRLDGHKVITRMDHASRTEEKLLGRLGAEVVAPAEHFSVAGTTGPLVEGEEERARGWGRSLAALLAAGTRGR
ncbi:MULTISPECIES: flavodoxin family protein [unclassified Geodermatophilus]